MIIHRKWISRKALPNNSEDAEQGNQILNKGIFFNYFVIEFRCACFLM